MLGRGGSSRGGGSSGDNGDRPAMNIIHRGKVCDSHPLKLLEFVCTVFPSVKRTTAKQWLKFNSILVNDEAQARFDFDLRVGDWVTVKAGKTSGPSVQGRSSMASPQTGPKHTASLSAVGLKVLYEDVALIVVDKPPGMPISQNDMTPVKGSQQQPLQRTVHSYINSYLSRRTADTKALPVHRMDDSESGVAVFAKSPAAKQYLQHHWHSFGFLYTVLCEGMFSPSQGTRQTFLSALNKTDPDALMTCAAVKSESIHTVGSFNYRTLDIASTISTSMRQSSSGSDSSRSSSDSSRMVSKYSMIEVSPETSLRKDQLRAQVPTPTTSQVPSSFPLAFPFSFPILFLLPAHFPYFFSY